MGHIPFGTGGQNVNKVESVRLRCGRGRGNSLENTETRDQHSAIKAIAMKRRLELSRHEQDAQLC